MSDKIITHTFTSSDGSVGYYVEINYKPTFGGFSDTHAEAYKDIVKHLEEKESK